MKSKGISPVAEIASVAGFLCLALASCGRKETSALSEDARLRQQIVGRWVEADIVFADKRHSGPLNATNYFGADGSFSYSSYMLKSNVSKTFNYEGTWVVTNTNIVLTLTTSSEPKVQPVGTIVTSQIIHIDDEQLTYVVDGQTIVWNRVK